MNIIELIEKKKKGQVLSEDEITFFIEGFCSGDIPDYQAAAWAMAVCLKGMNSTEIFNLTKAMVASGDIIDVEGLIDDIILDKHSTGGVGDKISLIISPILALYDIKLPKMSGRGLGITGGTIDKLESIPNFKTDLEPDEFLRVVKKIGFSIISQSDRIVPADKKLYALRDLTATVDSIPLIASSIMSKKIATGASHIVIDLKVGSGAFMKNIDEAKELAKALIDIAKKFQRKIVIFLTNMDSPLGKYVGNILEVKEALDVLKNRGEKHLSELSVNICSYVLSRTIPIFSNFADAKRSVQEIIQSGEAHKKFLDFVKCQGGDVDMLEKMMSQSNDIIQVKSKTSGYVTEINSYEIGAIAMESGAGRKKLGDAIDYLSGIELNKFIGDKVNEGDVLFKIHTAKTFDDSEIDKYTKSYTISEFNKKHDKNRIIEILE